MMVKRRRWRLWSPRGHPSRDQILSPYARQALGDPAVGLIVSEAQGRRNVMTVSFFSELAHHPTTLWVSIANSSYTHEMVSDSRRFTLAILNVRMREIAIKSATASGRDVDKCAGLRLYRSSRGFLFLDGTPSSIGCAVRDHVDLGDHTLFLADIIEGDVDSRPAVWRHLLLSDL